MTPEEYRDKQIPGHLDEVIYYKVQFLPHAPQCCGVEMRRAVYYRDRVRWKDHPWSEGRDGSGADFVDQWTIEASRDSGRSWSSEGRTSEGWRALWSEEWFRQAHATPEAALEKLLERMSSEARSKELAAAEVRCRIKELCAVAENAGRTEFSERFIEVAQ